MRTKAQVSRSREAADPAIAPEMVERVLQKAAELHTEELTQVRRSELFEAAAQAGIPARYVSAALEEVDPAPPPAKAPAAAAPATAGQSDAEFVGFFAALFAVSLASVYLADLLEPWASPLGVGGWGIGWKVLLCAVLWIVGFFVAACTMEANSRK